MLIRSVGLWVLGIIICHTSLAQVDTTFIYKTGMPYGTLDIRIAKSATRYYFLDEGKTFSFRESAPGVRSNAFKDMTSWDSSPYTQGNLREQNGSSSTFIMNYRLLFPQNYNNSYSEGYPLIIMIHGLGERGNCWNNDCHWADRTWNPIRNYPPAPADSNSELLNNDHNLLHGGNIHLQMRNAAGSRLPNDPSLPERSFPGFVLFPQNLNGWTAPQAQDVIRMIRLMIKKYNIDPDRIYIHGLSNGGAAVYDIIKRAPWLFSAAATMSAVSDGGIISQRLTPKIATIPLWLFQGGQDKNPTPSKTNSYVKNFRDAGLTVRYSFYENLGHGTWNTAYREPDFFSWLRSQKKTEIHAFADQPVICNTNGNGVKLEVAEGFLAYQWDRNGVIISGANTASYIAETPGLYRVRFSRESRTPSSAQWNEWSASVNVTTASPTRAEIAQTGTVVLKDLNNYSYAHLYSVKKADKYIWYKNGARFDLPGTVEDTLRYVRLSAGNCSTGPCTGNGAYTLVTSGYDNCPSPESEPIHVFFNNQAPISITAPTTFTSSNTTEGQTTLNWTDASSNEGGFEIWRRRQTGTTTFTRWEMPTITGPNVRTFVDRGLEPNSTYQYKIRAVGPTGRSNYTPAASNQFLIVRTGDDNQNPTTPTSLVATTTAIGEIALKWNPSTDNTGIREYVIYFGSSSRNTGSNASRFVLTNMPINENYTFTVRARDLGGNLSAASNSSAANTYVEGLYYKHSTGAFSDIDLIDWNFIEYTGKVDNFTLGPRTQEDYFNFQFEGYLYLNAGGSYTFQTTSDDGSRLTIDGTLAVDNDGKHGTRTITGAARDMTAGPHTINVKYFEDTGGQNLTVRYRGPDTGNNWMVIPNSALRSGNVNAAAADSVEVVEPSALQASVFPNPSREFEILNVSVQAEDTMEPVRVQLINMAGRPLYDQVFSPRDLEAGSQVTPNEKLPRGLYIMVIKQGNRTVRERVLVQE